LKFKKFGWNGVFFQIPEQMRFTRQGGNSSNGHIVLEAEIFMIEAKWEPYDQKKAKPLSEVGARLVQEMEKQAKKKKQIVKVLRKEDALVYKHKALYMVVRSPAEERVYMWYCAESERVFVWRFAFGIFDEDSKKMVKRVLNTLRCHGDEADVWSLMNFSFTVPRTFLLTETKMAVGRAHYMLTDRHLSAFAESAKSIFIEYFSMANLVYEDTYKDLGKWLEKNYLKDLRKQFKDRKIKLRPVEARRFKRHKMEIRQATTTSGFSSRRSALYSNATWYCARTNRIYTVTASSSIRRPIVFKRDSGEEDHKNMMEDFLSSFKCH